MKTGIRAGASYKGQYAGYKAGNRWQKNKIKKLEKRILNNENDTGAEVALKLVHKKIYGRSKPGNKGWFHPQEQKLEKVLKFSNDLDEKLEARAKLLKIQDVYYNDRPSAIPVTNFVSSYVSIADQLFNIGFISDQKRKFVNSRMARVRSR